METVKTSDALESQIMDDARGKARHVLESADKECARIQSDGEKRAADETASLNAKRDARVAALRQELTTTLPLDFMRTRLSFIQEALSRSLADLFASLSNADCARIIGRQLGLCASAFDGATVVVWHAGLSADEARKLVQGSLPGATVDAVKPLAADAMEKGALRGVIVETSDRGKRYRGTMNEMTQFLLEEYREQLVTALFGKDVTQ
jgi:vacuolar-type H+-ATPase subunit E/Vma4